MNKIREAYNNLVNVCKEEGLKPTVTLWFHGHLQDAPLTEEKALLIARNFLNTEDITVDYDTLGKERGLISEPTNDGCHGSLAIAFLIPEDVSK